MCEWEGDIVMTAATGEQITSVLTTLTDIAKAILGCVGSVVEVVMANPLLLIPVGCVMLYTIIRVFKTLF